MIKSLMDGPSFCTPSELAASNLPDSTLHCLTRQESFGLVFVAGSGLISLISVLIFFALVIKNVLRARRRKLIQKPMDIYLLSLFLAELIHGLGAALEFKWVYDGKVQAGQYCNAQGLLINLGSITIGISTLVIAWHTFICIWWTKVLPSLSIPCIVCATLWAYSVSYTVIAVSVVGDPHGLYYRPTPYWCWISSHFLVHRITGQWLWEWTALFFSVLFYSLIFFRNRGLFSSLDISSYQSPYASGIKRASYTMILYALTYCVLVMPTSIVRWREFFVQDRSGNRSRASPAAAIAVLSIYNLSGIVNIVIFFFTRSGILLFGRVPDRPDETLTDICDSWESERVVVHDKGKAREVSIDIPDGSGHQRSIE